MVKRDIIVIGASAGGIDALRELFRNVPPTLQAALFVVVHLQSRTGSLLTTILSNYGSLPAFFPEDGAPILPGKVYVAPADYHLLLERGHVHLDHGPKENFQRPCINTTFRSAALAYGSRVIAVVLSGNLDDGSAGAWEIKRRGGVVMVQHPEQASFPSMPLSVLRAMEVDHVARVEDIGGLLAKLTQDDGNGPAVESPAAQSEPKLVDLTCPECRGNIWESQRGGAVQYSCRVGHSFSPLTMLSEHTVAQEKTLWAAVVALQEGAVLARRLADSVEPDLQNRLLEESREREKQADLIKQMLGERSAPNLEG